MLKKPPDFGGLTHKIRKIVFSYFRCPVFAFLVSRLIGYGMHHCMGQELARLEINTVITLLTRQYPQMRLRHDNLNDLPWCEGIVLRRPDALPVII
ncbi:hypothetical protein ABG138_004499 [Salmonella bongori]|nr:hypothetical protein [Salmonella bongori serovar 48:z81:-]